MRGLVMLLMLTDHASEAFNASRPVTDSIMFQGWDQPLDAGEFLFRFLSHLCAPAFLFLAGTGLALSIARRLEHGVGQVVIDRDLAIRGLLLLAVEYFFINHFWLPGLLLLQVLFAIGASMLCMIALRRLGDPVLVVLGLLALLIAEPFISTQIVLPRDAAGLIEGLAITGGFMPMQASRPLLIAYPLLPWLGIMLLGFVFGRMLRRYDAASRSRATGAEPRAEGASPARIGSAARLSTTRRWALAIAPACIRVQVLRCSRYFVLGMASATLGSCEAITRLFSGYT